MTRTYSELISIPDYKDRFDYLKIDGFVGDVTFGFDRYLNQKFYRSTEWRTFRRGIIIRDAGCDLAHPDYQIKGLILIHHLNPLSIDDIKNLRPCVLDPENVVCASKLTHNAVHYGDFELLPTGPIERSPNDTCPWR